jgi:hypothetical protein
MAGEVRGKIYEAITKIALERAFAGKRPALAVFWHEKPDWIDIDPDLTVGSSANEIQAVVLVTHSGSEGYSQKKFWRNCGEILQWKVQGKTAVNCYSVLFESAVKPKLLLVEESVLDGMLDLAKTSYGKALKAFVRTHEKEFGNSDDARALHVENLVDRSQRDYDSGFAGLFALFSSDLNALLGKRREGLDAVWAVLRRDYKRVGRLPQVRKTYVRNGLAKLMVFRAADRERLYDTVLKHKEISLGEVPKHAVIFGWMVEDIDQARLEDTEIRSVIETLGAKKCERLIDKAPSRMRELVRQVSAVGNSTIYHDFVVEHFDELSTPRGMLHWLEACYADPAGILPNDPPLEVPPAQHWLFVFCITLEKARQNKVVGYGISKLAEDTGISEIGQGGFLIPPYIYREKPLEASIVKEIARVFAEKLKEIGRDMLDSPDFRKAMTGMLRQRELYILSTYRGYHPLLWLLEEELASVGIVTAQVTVPFFTVRQTSTGAATSTFITVDASRIIYRQSCHGSHVNDKTKELSARFRVARANMDSGALRELFLLIDGEWRDEDLRVLARSGLAGIYYPDELDELVRALALPSSAKVIPAPTVSKLTIAAEADESAAPAERRNHRHGK